MDILQLIPSFGGFAFTILAFIVALSVIVAVHEYGHYIVGRWSGIHAEVFSLGFGPVLWSRHDRHGTRWQIAALPFGGYVKFLGDADAASGRPDDSIAAMDAKTARQTMHGAPLWARAATVIAGPAFNFILSIFVFAGVILIEGEAASPLTVSDLRPMPPAWEVGLEPGDQILEIAGQPAPAAEDLLSFTETLPGSAALDYRVLRDGQEMTVRGPFPLPPLVGTLQPQSAAYDIEMKVGDVISAIDGTPIATFEDLRTIVGASDGRALQAEVWRDGERLEFVLVPRATDLPNGEGGFEQRWLIGITGGLFFEPQTVSPGLGTSLGYGVEQTIFIVESSLTGLWSMITGAISSCNLSGPIGIAQTSGAMASQGLMSFVWFVAVLSTAVGLLNLFPIPVLDGGHLVFHAYEWATGRPPSDGALRVLMGAGLTVVLALMVFALGNDLFC